MAPKRVNNSFDSYSLGFEKPVPGVIMILILAFNKICEHYKNTIFIDLVLTAHIEMKRNMH